MYREVIGQFPMHELSVLGTTNQQKKLHSEIYNCEFELESFEIFLSQT